jgi:hypothetical protein
MRLGRHAVDNKTKTDLVAQSEAEAARLKAEGWTQKDFALALVKALCVFHDVTPYDLRAVAFKLKKEQHKLLDDWLESSIL